MRRGSSGLSIAKAISYMRSKGYPISTLYDGLQALYSLNEESGDAVDSIKALNLTQTHDPVRTTGPTNLVYARAFVAASTQMLSLASAANSVLQVRTLDATFSFWVFFVASADYQTVYSCRDSSALTNPGFSVLISPAGKVVVYFCDGSVDRLSWESSDALSIEAFSHVVITLDRDGLGTIFINGAAKGVFPIYSQYRDSNPSVSAVIGRLSLEIYHLNSSISQFAKWNRVLTGSEILELYNGGAGNSFPF